MNYQEENNKEYQCKSNSKNPVLLLCDESTGALEDSMNNMINTMKTMIIVLIVIASILGGVIIYN